MNVFAETLAEVMRRPALLRVPEFAVKLAMGQMSEVVLTGPRAVPRRLVDGGYAFVFPELASALADLV
jgi:NAD dependent epimerase/dehydratase family enzyme